MTDSEMKNPLWPQAEIHPTAIIDDSVEISRGVRIGPWCHVKGPASIGSGTVLMERVSVGPWVIMGRNNIVHMGAVIGHAPQDLSYNGEETWTHIGSQNEIREYVTIHRGSRSGLKTVVGDHNLLMGLSHVAHDVEIGNRVILANGALLAGHVHVEDQAFVSGGVLVHQFVRIGRLALLRGGSRTSRDVPPYCIMDGTHTVRSLNRVGLKRAGVSAEERSRLKMAFRILFGRRKMEEGGLVQLESDTSPLVRELVRFIRDSKRGVCHGTGRLPDIDTEMGVDYD
ncbi:MAG: acyl-ACP--UDP-N-acetylglucosamine O-acyltransferase [Leptospirillum sp.]